MRDAALINQNCHHGRLSLSANDAVEITGYCQPKRVVSRPQGGASLALRTSICLRPSLSTAALPPTARTFRLGAPTPDHASPSGASARRCRAAAPAGVLGSGVLAVLDVLSGHHGTTGCYHCAGRHSGPGSPYTAASGCQSVPHSRASTPSKATRRGLTRVFSTGPVTSHAAPGRPPQPPEHRILRSTSPTVWPAP